MATREPVAITGLGIVCALGSSRGEVAAACRRGERRFSPVQRFDAAAFKVNLAAHAPDLDTAGRFGARTLRRTSRTDRLALWAAADAVEQAGLAGARRQGAAVVVGASSGGMEEMERETARLLAAGATSAVRRASVAWSYPVWATARCLAGTLGLDGPRATYMTACSSAAHALGVAMHRVRRGDLDVAVAGGAEALCRLTLAGFGVLGVLDPQATRPFARSRAGITLGEGAAFFVLERLSEAQRRGAPVLAVLAGYGAASDAHHMVHPREDGAGALAAMQAALADAGLEPQQVDYINAHGTGTVQNDAMEARAIEALLGERTGDAVAVSSSKSMLGHTLGAAGALEAALTVLGMGDGFVPPNPGVLASEAISFTAARLVTEAAPVAPTVALSTSFAFGGNNAALALCRPEAMGPAAASKPARHAPGPAWITGAALSNAAGTAVGATALLEAWERGASPAGALTGLAPDAILGARVTRRMDPLSASLTALMTLACKDAGVEPDASWGIGIGTSFGALDATRAFLTRLLQKGPSLANPIDFPNLVHNAAAGHASIVFGAAGANIASCQEELAFDEALRSMSGRVRAGHLPGALCGGADLASAALVDGYRALGSAAAVGQASVAAAIILESAATSRRPWAQLAALGTAGVQGGPRQAIERALAAGGDAPIDVWLTGATTPAQEQREDEAATLAPLARAQRHAARARLGDAGAAGAAVIAVGAALIARGKARRVLVTSVARDGAASATLLCAVEGR